MVLDDMGLKHPFKKFKNPEQSMKVTGIYINEDFIRADQANRELINFANSAFSDGKSWKDHK